MLCNLSDINKEALAHITYVLFSHGYVPKESKTYLIMLILKPGQDPAEPVSYRPITLPSCLEKVIEKPINNRLK